jgi:hypothetical protein
MEHAGSEFDLPTVHNCNSTVPVVPGTVVVSTNAPAMTMEDGSFGCFVVIIIIINKL